MARLFVKSKGQLIQDLLLNEGKSYIAGRRTDADIVLPSDKGISREHFKIYFEDGAWNLKVLSHYGKVFSSGVLIELTHLEQGQKFQVESFEFEFVAHENSIALANESPGRSVSVPMQLPDENEKTYIRPSVLQVPFLKILNSLGEVRELIKLEESGPWVSGREGQLPIIISDSRVSRRQFEITFRNNNYYIQDLGSSNGTFINEVMISNVEAHQLQSGDVIRVLENEMIFELRDPQFEKMARSNELSIVNSGPMMPQSMMSPQPMMSPDQMMIPSSPWSEIPMEPMGAPPETPMDKFKNLDPKKRMIYVVSAVAIIAIALFGDFNGKKELPPEVESGKTPFEKLKKEEQDRVKNAYNMIKQYKMQNKYEHCLQESDVIFQLLPLGYEDAQSIFKECQSTKNLIEEQEKQKKEEKQTIEREEKIQNITQQCEKRINEYTTKEVLDNCLQEAILLDPLHRRIVYLQTQVEEIERVRAQKAEDQKNYQSRAASLQRIFNHAEAVDKKAISPYDKISEYEKVIDSQLPDPQGLKSKSKNRIQQIKDTIFSKTKDYVMTAKNSYSSGDIKRAIASLRQAKQVDPLNSEIEELIAKYIVENKQKLRPLYEESIIEERFGNIEAAIERWKKIIENDNSDGEYYFKAYKKLKDYGALSK